MPGNINTIIEDLVKGFIDAAHAIPGFAALTRGDKASLCKG